MKTTLRVWLVLLLPFVMFLPTSMASAEQARIEFTGYEECTGETLVIPVEWYPGLNWQARDVSETCLDYSSNTSMMTGVDHIYDAAIRAVGSGNLILVGKLRMQTDEGGLWIGSWVYSPSDNLIKIVARGEGLYEGMHLYWFIDVSGPVSPFYGYISYQGE